MAITFKGTELKLEGTFPVVGEKAPDFTLVNTTLEELNLGDLKGKKIILNIFPSIDTSVCALQLKTFSKLVSEKEDVAMVFTSLDLPFALKRFCGAEGIANAITASDFRYRTIEKGYGVKMVDGPLAGLYARAVLILDENKNILYTELVSEVTNEPNYEAAIKALA